MNKNSLSLGKISGIPIYVHWSFIAIIAYAVYLGYSNGFGVWGTAWYLMLVLSVFGCVLLHELGHSLSARRYGIGTEDITLLPIGGLARLQYMPRKPIQELVIALMGPAVNVVIAIVLLLVHFLFFGGFDEMTFPGNFGVNPFVTGLLFINILLVAFNMIPAFPMDGGRVLRALLSFRLSYVNATKIASIVGKFAAICFVAYGFFRPEISEYFSPGNNAQLGPDYMLMGVGAFVYFSANNEGRMASMEGALEGHTVSELIRTGYTVFQTTDTIGSAMNTLAAGLETNFLVLNEEKVEGIMTHAILKEHVKTNPDRTLGEVMRKDIFATDPEELLLDVLSAVRENRQPIVPVFDKTSGLLLGVLDQRTIYNFIQLKNSGQS